MVSKQPFRITAPIKFALPSRVDRGISGAVGIPRGEPGSPYGSFPVAGSSPKIKRRSLSYGRIKGGIRAK